MLGKKYWEKTHFKNSVLTILLTVLYKYKRIHSHSQTQRISVIFIRLILCIYNFFGSVLDLVMVWLHHIEIALKNVRFVPIYVLRDNLLHAYCALCNILLFTRVWKNKIGRKMLRLSFYLCQHTSSSRKTITNLLCHITRNPEVR